MDNINDDEFDDDLGSEASDHNLDNADEDFDIDEYQNQNFGIDNSRKIQNNDEEDFDIDEIIDFEDSFNSHQYRKKTKTNIKLITKYEYSKLFGKLAEYIAFSKIEVPEGIFEIPEGKIDVPGAEGKGVAGKTFEEVLGVKSGDHFLISRKWIEFSKVKGLELPLTIVRSITNNVKEELQIEDVNIPSEYYFRDEGPDNLEDMFYQNFREKPYENIA